MKHKQTPKKVAVYFRFGSESRCFILPDDRKAYQEYLKKKVNP
jgi:hypothetical protein